MLEMTVKPGRGEELVALFERLRVFERALEVEGCHDVIMLRRDQQFFVQGWWDDATAYQRWVDHPDRHQGSDELNALLAEPITTSSVGGIFDVALTGPDSRESQ